MGAGIAARVAGLGEHAAKMLVKADARFAGDPGWVGIQGLAKILDLPLDLCTARWCDRWLNLTLHFRLAAHP
jgi:hypothetical protein